MTPAGVPGVRPYVPEDEATWLRCRVLAFLGTDHFDDVITSKPTYNGPSIETIAVHPDAARSGVGRALLAAALDVLPATVQTIDAWTREDTAANRWYVANGFRETYRYLHVYATGGAVPSSRPDLTPIVGFFHASIEDEAGLRDEFGRVYVCRRYERPTRTRTG